MEIGSFIELDLKNTGEYFTENSDLCRLNTGRSAILHACRLYKIEYIYVPYYICPSVINFLIEYGIKIKFYSIDDRFLPCISNNEPSSAIIIVNHYGLLSQKRISELTQKYFNVIVDNCPAFFSPPVEGAYTVYSARKFFGVPDGSYLIGKDANSNTSDYELDVSSDNVAFLFKRLEKGCNAVYDERMRNELRLDKSGVLKMSILTRKLLSSIDYEWIMFKRRENFNYAVELFKTLNMLNINNFVDDSCLPIVYPLIIKDNLLVERLKSEKIYTGRWWNGVLKRVPENSFEAFLSKFMIPIPIDQRYGKYEFDHIFNILIMAINS